MDYTGKERRDPLRSYVEPYDTGTFLEFTLGDKECQFNLLDTSPGGVGMLVMNRDTEILEKLKYGDQIKMNYGRPDTTTISMTFEIRHITEIERGPFKGHFQVGLSLQSDPG